jgi:hypothetical protein
LGTATFWVRHSLYKITFTYLCAHLWYYFIYLTSSSSNINSFFLYIRISNMNRALHVLHFSIVSTHRAQATMGSLVNDPRPIIFVCK